MPDGVASATTVQERIFEVVKRPASILGMKSRGPQRRITWVKISGGHGENTVPGVMPGGP